MWDKYVKFEELLGKTFKSVKQVGEDKIIFTSVDGEMFKMFHSQDCCESVYIESVVGDLKDLVGSPILLAEESESSEYQSFQEEPCYDESFTWTFYKLATIKGYVDIRWYGESNGYYSESVDLVRMA